MYKSYNKTSYTKRSDANNAAASSYAFNNCLCVDTVIIAVSIFVLRLAVIINPLIINDFLLLKKQFFLKKQNVSDSNFGYVIKETV